MPEMYHRWDARSSSTVRAFGTLGLAALSIGLSGLCAGAQDRGQSVSTPIVIDGRFDDWADVPVLVADSGDAPRSALDLAGIKASYDDGAFYALMDLGRPANLQALDGTISIAFDADGNAGTGMPVFGLSGVDLIVDLSPPYEVGGMPAGVGVGVRSASQPASRIPSGPQAKAFGAGDSYDVGFTYAPKYTHRRFEMRLAREPELVGLGRFGGDRFTAKAVFTGPDGAILDEIGPFTQELSARRTRPALIGDAADPLARPKGADLRVLSWNVSHRSLVQRSDRFRRVIAAVQPDLLLLDEVPGDLTAETVLALLSGRESGVEDETRSTGAAEVVEAAEWSLVYGEAGGRQRGVIAARRGSVSSLRELARIEYPADLPRQLDGVLPPGFGGVEAGVPAAAGLAEFGGRRILAITVDLQCCGNGDDTPQEAIRRAEAQALSTALSDALSRGIKGIGGIIVAGDLNLVGSSRPLDLLTAGLDLDGSDLAVAEPLDLLGLTDATWTGVRWARAFPPGRLDFVLFSDTSLELRQAFVFDTAVIPGVWLEAHGLLSDDTAAASDHFPIVTDFSWQERPSAP
jgi:endonuclease/exonuclease/phosphatase family metal-dependent hydrolase